MDFVAAFLACVQVVNIRNGWHKIYRRRREYLALCFMVRVMITIKYLVVSHRSISTQPLVSVIWVWVLLPLHRTQSDLPKLSCIPKRGLRGNSGRLGTPLQREGVSLIGKSSRRSVSGSDISTTGCRLTLRPSSSDR